MILRLLGWGHSIHTPVGEIERVYGEGKTVSTYINIYYGVIGELGGGGGGEFFPVTDIDSHLSK